jgi:DHA3 family macrolide efflux protein-like MFS transporter
VDILDGLNYIWQKSGLRELVLASLFLSFFTVPIIVLLPFFVEDSLKVSVDWYGFLIAGYGAGSLCGFILAGVLKLQGTSRSRVMVVLIILESVGYGALGLVSSPVVALALAFLGGATGGFFTILLTTIVQATTPTEIRGRVFGLLATLSGAIAPIAMGLTGPLADLTGHNIRLIYLACGAIMLVLSVFVCSSRALRRYLAYEPSPEKSQAVDSQVVALH